MPRIMITGGPGSGKTTLLEALKNSGFDVIPEASRELIRQHVALGSDCLPWIDLACFGKASLDKMIVDFHSCNEQKICFFDRGIPDILAYMRVGKATISSSFLGACEQFRYENLVLVAPPWREIYVNDDERWQTVEQACELYMEIVKVYQNQGYNVVEIPRFSVNRRVEFIKMILRQNCFDTVKEICSKEIANEI